MRALTCEPLMKVFLFLLLLSLPIISFGQHTATTCDPLQAAVDGTITIESTSRQTFCRSRSTLVGSEPSPSSIELAANSRDRNQESTLLSTPAPARKQGFHWGRALMESFVFLSIEQAYVVHDDYRWVVAENGVPFNHYWRDYKQSLSAWVNAGWDDGDPKLYSYVGHPIQGALTGYIQIQNDPKGEKLEFANTRAYWHSRFRALLWNAVYSTQWNIGPLSELTVEKYGTHVRSPWNQDGSWPCTHKPCVNGVGQVDLVLTPIGGFGWLLMEDVLDKKVVERLEGATRNSFLIDTARCALNPIRGGANILHGKAPWHRASRDARAIYYLNHFETLAKPVP